MDLWVFRSDLIHLKRFLSLFLFRVRVIKSEDDVLVVCPTILTEDGMQAQHLGATLALYRLVKGQVRLF
jgi:hypothetical protein